MQSILLAGAGVPAGSVYGASDPMGGEPAAAPLAPPDLAAIVLHLMGVRPDTMLTDPQGRAIVACQGTPVAELIGA